MTKQELIDKHLKGNTTLRGSSHHFTVTGQVTGLFLDNIMAMLDDHELQIKKNIFICKYWGTSPCVEETEIVFSLVEALDKCVEDFHVVNLLGEQLDSKPYLDYYPKRKQKLAWKEGVREELLKSQS